jgi:hypothetical protein
LRIVSICALGLHKSPNEKFDLRIGRNFHGRTCEGQGPRAHIFSTMRAPCDLECLQQHTNVWRGRELGTGPLLLCVAVP